MCAERSVCTGVCGAQGVTFVCFSCPYKAAEQFKDDKSLEAVKQARLPVLCACACVACVRACICVCSCVRLCVCVLVRACVDYACAYVGLLL